jgi:type IV secretory pathway VirB10-like protein
MAHDPFDDLDGASAEPPRHPDLSESELSAETPEARRPLADEPFSFDDDSDLGEAPRGDLLAGTDDGRYEPVRVNRRLVLGGLLIAGAAVLLGLLVFSGGPNRSDRDVTGVERPEAAPPDFLERGGEDPYALDGDPSAPAPEVYAADPYADPYGPSYATPAYTPDYGTSSVGPTASSSYGASPQPVAAREERLSPEADAFARALASPVVARTGALTLGPGAAPVDDPDAIWLDPELQREVDEIRLIAEQLAPAASGPPPTAQAAEAVALPPLVAPEPPASASGAPGPETRRAFAERTSALGEGRYGVRVQVPETPFVLQAGTIIPAALVTGIDSELPGAVVGQVTRDVYDSRSQYHVLVPKGSRLIGEYDDQIAYGQNRALVAWTRIVFPDGRSVALPGLDAKDLRGYSGLRGRVDRHFAQTFGSAVLLATVGAGAQLALPDGGGRDFAQSPQEVIAGQIALELSRVASKVVERGLDVQPTLRIAPGHRFTVFLARDLAFAAPYRTAPSEPRFTRPPTPHAPHGGADR